MPFFVSFSLQKKFCACLPQPSLLYSDALPARSYRVCCSNAVNTNTKATHLQPCICCFWPLWFLLDPLISHSGVWSIRMHVCDDVCTDLDLLILLFIPIRTVQPLLVRLWCCHRLPSGWRRLSSFWCISYNVQEQARERQHQFFLVV